MAVGDMGHLWVPTATVVPVGTTLPLVPARRAVPGADSVGVSTLNLPLIHQLRWITQAPVTCGVTPGSMGWTSPGHCKEREKSLTP